MLLQVDGSRHAWLEERGPGLTLFGLVDDATNKVPAARFQHEDSAGYLRLFRNQAENHGLPWAIYRDQHGTLQRNDSNWSVTAAIGQRISAGPGDVAAGKPGGRSLWTVSHAGRRGTIRNRRAGPVSDPALPGGLGASS